MAFGGCTNHKQMQAYLLHEKNRNFLLISDPLKAAYPLKNILVIMFLLIFSSGAWLSITPLPHLHIRHLKIFFKRFLYDTNILKHILDNIFLWGLVKYSPLPPSAHPALADPRLQTAPTGPPMAHQPTNPAKGNTCQNITKSRQKI